MVICVASQTLTRLHKFIPAEDLAEPLEHTSMYCQQIMACTYKQKDEVFDNNILKIKILTLKIKFLCIPNVYI